MKKQIDQFLDQATQDIFSRKKIKEARAELESHIYESIDHYSRSMSQNLAVQQTLKDMGNPKEISEAFNKVYPVRHYFLFYALITVSLITTIIIFNTVMPFFNQSGYDQLSIDDIATKLDAVDSKPVNITYDIDNTRYQIENILTLQDGSTVLYSRKSKINFIGPAMTTYSLKDCSTGCFITYYVPDNLIDNVYMSATGILNNRSLIVLDTFEDKITLNYESILENLNDITIELDLGGI